MLITTAIALGLVVPSIAPAHAAGEAAQAQQGTKSQETTVGRRQDRHRQLGPGGPVHGRLDRRTAVRQEVYGETGEEAGEVEDLIIGPDGALPAVIVEVGGFLDVGDTHCRVRWEDVQLAPDLEGISVPVSMENIEKYSIFPEDQEDAAERGSRARELMNDYVSLADYLLRHGAGRGLQDGDLSATGVYPDVGYGVDGPYAYPWYGYKYG
jgi:PRC-barrel domain